ncbi:hypothetical protein TrST_g7273 [Triparma strigata]|uniref:Chromosome segregation in meiosis protein 3 domain-containing protein n=1 Tax=Triparma strigata TaxID=1606541 RepID=A0A9W7ADN6_9STRA|nr:hypothetical protein TrST_g7273 [Triparma strigata]
MSQLDKYTSRSGLSDSSDVDSDEEEARMDAFFGTADEVKVKGRKGDLERSAAALGADTDLQAEVESKRKKRKKLELGKEGLLSSSGLVAVHRSFRDKLKGYKGRGNERAYAKNVSRLYREWANSLFAGLHWEDVLMRIEGAGGKEDVKNYLNMMRENERREGLEKRFGLEGAERILRAMGMQSGNEISGAMAREGDGGWGGEEVEVEMSEGRRRQMEALLGGGDDENSEPPNTNVVTSANGLKSPVNVGTGVAAITPATEPLAQGKRSERLQGKEGEEEEGGAVEEVVGGREDVSDAEADFDELEKDSEGEDEAEAEVEVEVEKEMETETEKEIEIMTETEGESEGLNTQELRTEGTEGSEEAK